MALGGVVAAGWSEAHSASGALRFDLWVPTRERDAAVALLRHALDGVGLRTLAVAAQAQPNDWQDGLRRHHQPIDIGSVRVRPPWEPARAGAIDIVIDPGMAFGTGQHATTKGCLDLLLDVPVGSVLDVGCGTGILAIAAAKLGHSPVRAVDNDPLAVEATVRNADHNGAQVDAVLADVADPLTSPPDLVLANITRLHVRALAATFAGVPPQAAILSGFLGEDVEDATAPWQELGLRPEDRRDADGWTAVRLVRV